MDDLMGLSEVMICRGDVGMISNEYLKVSCQRMISKNVLKCLP